MLVAAASTLDLAIGSILVVFGVVFLYGSIPSRANRYPADVPQGTSLATGFLLLGLGRLLGSDVLGALGLVGVIASTYFRYKRRRRHER